MIGLTLKVIIEHILAKSYPRSFLFSSPFLDQDILTPRAFPVLIDSLLAVGVRIYKAAPNNAISCDIYKMLQSCHQMAKVETKSLTRLKHELNHAPDSYSNH